MNKYTRINQQIRARELRVIGSEGENFGVLSLEDALKKAKERELDLIEISPDAKPPVAKIADYGKFQYEQKKRARAAKSNARHVEIKTIQIKPATGEHDLEVKAKRISKWLKEGNRVKLDLFLAGRAKYMDKDFLEDRMKRVLHYITEEYTIAQGPIKSPKGRTVIIEKKS